MEIVKSRNVYLFGALADIPGEAWDITQHVAKVVPFVIVVSARDYHPSSKHIINVPVVGQQIEGQIVAHGFQRKAGLLVVLGRSPRLSHLVGGRCSRRI